MHKSIPYKKTNKRNDYSSADCNSDKVMYLNNSKNYARKTIILYPIQLLLINYGRKLKY